MPHRVANFFRSSTSSLETQVNSLAKKTVASTTRRKDSPSRSGRGSGSSDRSERVVYASSIEEDADDSHVGPRTQRLKMGESRTNSFSSDSHHHHRISFPGMHFGRSSKESHISTLAVLDWKLESPPIVLYGDAEHSSGAIVSGQLFLDIREDGVEVESFEATLNIHVTQKRPFANHCNECAHQTTELKRWCLLPNPLVLTKGKHSFPFSVLLEGHLPASMDGPLVTISYEFRAEAAPKANGAVQTPIRFSKILDVKRSLMTSEMPHHSVRVFPPTNIKASAHYPHVIHPIGSNTMTLKLDGISRHNSKVGTVEYWKLKKLTWRLEETAKTVAPACEKHSPKVGEGAEQQKKGIVRTDTRVIGEKTLFSGWKSNYMSTSESSVEFELEYSLAKHAKFACDTKCRDGTEVTHQLMVEMVVSQEWAPVNKPGLVTHTGVGRILRMHFNTTLTERAGIGISWDNEAPPIYQDVPPSPPAYCHDTVLDGESSIAEIMDPLDDPSGEIQDHRSTGSSSDRARDD
ncbi:protein LDB19 [Echria macrotheca]|uniref:Protein LDB19 n=1 Tax=Echria macrotheca TaxID=438768 RepID=A0AAJ0B8C0_9PEZI|nr:protein LDB19 [Echria macrotheca]